MRLSLFLTIFISTLFLIAQESRPLKIRVVDGSTHRVLSTIGKLNLVRVKMDDGSVYSGHIKINSDSNLVIKGNVIRPEMISYINNQTPSIIAASSLLLYPLDFILTPGLIIWVAIKTPVRSHPHYVVVSNKSKDDIQLDGIKDHKTKDSLTIVNNPDSIYQSTLRINPRRLEQKAKCLGAPSDFIFTGTDLEKMVVPNFSFNAEYFFKPYFGIFAQMGYKPLNPDGSVFYMTNRQQPYYFCEHYMFRVSPLITIGNDPKRHSFFFIGPTAYYKTMNADHVNFCLYNNGDGDDRYVTYWYDETIKGLGLRVGIIPKNRLGLGVSVEVSYRFSKSHSFYPEHFWNSLTQTHYSINNHDFSVAESPCFDASVTWRLRIKKHK